MKRVKKMSKRKKADGVELLPSVQILFRLPLFLKRTEGSSSTLYCQYIQ